MNKLLLFLSALSISYLSFAKSVKLTGFIGGKYSIDMELEKSSGLENTIQGKYKYSGKKSFLTLKGKMYSDYVIQLDEYNSKGIQTGSFYLEWESGEWKGKWTSKEKHFNVSLKVQTGDIKQFREFDFIELQKECNSNLTGSYANEYYFLNDMWLYETGNMEIGFNGGVVSVEEIHPDTVKVRFELVCGPTYHVAYFDGYASKIGDNKYEFNQSLWGEGEACHLVFHFTTKGMSIDQKSSSMDCEFGARAYAGGDFKKIHDTTSKKETVDIQDILKLK